MKYLVSLDYDNQPLSSVKAEAAWLRREFKIPLEIWQSSKNSYHIRSGRSVGLLEAMKVLEASNCSQAYKEVCRRLQAFPIRTGEKLIFDEKNNVRLIKPETIRLS